MKRAAPVLALLVWPSVGMAMNWEGHDDWMDGIAPGYTTDAFGSDVAPLPSPDCPVTAKAAAENPYEQVPLPGHNCRTEDLRHPPAPLTPQ